MIRLRINQQPEPHAWPVAGSPVISAPGIIAVERIAPTDDPASCADCAQNHVLFTRLRRDCPLSQAEVPGYGPCWKAMKFDDVQDITRQHEYVPDGGRSKAMRSQARRGFDEVADGIQMRTPSGAPRRASQYSTSITRCAKSRPRRAASM